MWCVVCVVLLGIEPSHIDILSKSIHVYALDVTAIYSTRTGVAPVADMYRHPMDGLDMSP